MIITLTFFTRQGWKLVDMFTCVFAVGYAETEREIKCFQQFILEKMSFDHTEIAHRVVANNKFHTKNTKKNS